MERKGLTHLTSEGEEIRGLIDDGNNIISNFILAYDKDTPNSEDTKGDSKEIQSTIIQLLKRCGVPKNSIRWPIATTVLFTSNKTEKELNSEICNQAFSTPIRWVLYKVYTYPEALLNAQPELDSNTKDKINSIYGNIKE